MAAEEGRKAQQPQLPSCSAGLCCPAPAQNIEAGVETALVSQTLSHTIYHSAISPPQIYPTKGRPLWGVGCRVYFHYVLIPNTYVIVIGQGVTGQGGRAGERADGRRTRGPDGTTGLPGPQPGRWHSSLAAGRRARQAVPVTHCPVTLRSHTSCV